MSAVDYKIKNMQGAEVGTVSLDPSVFAGTINEVLVHDVVTWQRNKARAGTHSTLNRAKIQVTGKKMYKQKGTGRARHASYGSPIFVGGAVTFGPQPRSYEVRMNKKARKQALVSVLSHKVAGEKLVVVDSLSTDGKTKSFAAALGKLGVGKSKAMVVVANDNDAVIRSARNIAKIQTAKLDGINVYDLMKSTYLVCSKDTVLKLQEKVKGMK